MSGSFNAGSRPIRGRGRPRGTRSTRGMGRARGRGVQVSNVEIDDTTGLESLELEEAANCVRPPVTEPDAPCVPYVRETWSKYALHFFENTRRRRLLIHLQF